MATSSGHRHELATAFGGAVLVVVIAALSLWVHHSLSAAGPARSSPAALAVSAAADPPLNGQLRAWVDDAKPSIDEVLLTGDHFVATAAQGDIPATAAACQTTASAVANAQQHLPSPDPALNMVLQRAFSDYQTGIRHCVSGTQRQDAIDIGQGAGFVIQGKAELRKAYAVIEAEVSSDPAVLTA